LISLPTHVDFHHNVQTSSLDLLNWEVIFYLRIIIPVDMFLSRSIVWPAKHILYPFLLYVCHMQAKKSLKYSPLMLVLSESNPSNCMGLMYRCHFLVGESNYRHLALVFSCRNTSCRNGMIGSDDEGHVFRAALLFSCTNKGWYCDMLE
jgi:hypothetical protein